MACLRMGEQTSVSSGVVKDMEKIVSLENDGLESVEGDIFRIYSEPVHYGYFGSFVGDQQRALVGLLIDMD